MHLIVHSNLIDPISYPEAKRLKIENSVKIILTNITTAAFDATIDYFFQLIELLS